MIKEDKPRYSRVSDIIELVTLMNSKPNGITIKDIMTEYGVSRRTAERMRDSVLNIFSNVDEIYVPEDDYKHWGFTSDYSIRHLLQFSPKEIANIEQLIRRTSNKELKRELGETVRKLKSFHTKNLNSIENNVELILQTEGYAIRQMPQYKVNLNHIDIIRRAMRESKCVRGIYHDKKRVIEPLGIIYGEKLYLVAREKAKGDGIYNYFLHKFENMELTNQEFDKGNFSLQEYTSRSFGIYQGEILNVKLSFSKELAKEAKNYNFHTTQKIKEEKDGTVTVTFKASGSWEILWHVFKWGAGCKIVSPKSLQNEYVKRLKDNLQNY